MSLDALRALNQVRALGISVLIKGDKLSLNPRSLVTPEVLAEMKAHKPDILSIIISETYPLRDDEKPWVEVAVQVLKGEFEEPIELHGASLIKSLLIGVRHINHPRCHEAKSKLLDLMKVQLRKSRKRLH
jgi:hypothetical protein